MKWLLFSWYILSFRCFCILLFADEIYLIFNHLSCFLLMGLIWLLVYCEIWSCDAFIFKLAFFLNVMVIRRRSGTLPSWQWCSQWLDSKMADVKFFSPHLELAGLISVLLWGRDQNEEAEIRLMNKCSVLSLELFGIGLKWQDRNRSNLRFLCSRRRDIFLSCRINTPRYFWSCLKSRERIGIFPTTYIYT